MSLRVCIVTPHDEGNCAPTLATHIAGQVRGGDIWVGVGGHRGGPTASVFTFRGRPFAAVNNPCVARAMFSVHREGTVLKSHPLIGASLLEVHMWL